MRTCEKRRLSAHKLVVATVLSLGLIWIPATPGQAQSDTNVAKELSNAFTAAAKGAMPAVVSIRVERTVEVRGGMGGLNDPFGLFPEDMLRRFFGGRLPQQQRQREYRQQGQGSGFIISSDGYILTNNHVVGDVDRITVELQDGRTFENAQVVGTDPGTEVALIKIDADNLPVLPMGKSDQIEIGNWVIAIGNPFGLGETVTVGVISAVGRSNVNIAAYEDFIQTDAAINPGNSGGPLINLDGEAIGINTAIYSRSGGYMGIGFAIPINMARTIADQLRETGRVTRGYLGIYGQDITPDMARLGNLDSTDGVIVSQVEPDSPAAGAGLETGDVLLEMNGNTIRSWDSFRNDVANIAPGSQIRFRIWRDGRTRRINVTLGERPTEVARGDRPNRGRPSQETLGVQVQDLTPDMAQRFGYALGEGVVVTAVTPGGPAARAGIQPGDLIQRVNMRRIRSVDEFENAMGSLTEDKVLLLMRRDEVSQFVTVELNR